MKILSEIESVIRIESSLARDTARAVLNLAVLPLARTRGVEVCRNVVWNVSNDELRFRETIRAEVLKVVMYKFTLHAETFFLFSFFMLRNLSRIKPGMGMPSLSAFSMMEIPSLPI